MQAAHRQSPVQPTLDIEFDRSCGRSNEADLTTTGNYITRNLYRFGRRGEINEYVRPVRQCLKDLGFKITHIDVDTEVRPTFRRLAKPHDVSVAGDDGTGAQRPRRHDGHQADR